MNLSSDPEYAGDLTAEIRGIHLLQSTLDFPLPMPGLWFV